MSETKVAIKSLEDQPTIGKRAQQKQLAEELMQIGRRCAEHLHHPGSSTEHGDILYNEKGLP